VADHHEQEDRIRRDPLQKGNAVPRHAHENRTSRARVEDALRFWLGDDDKDQVVATEVVVVPASLPQPGERNSKSLTAATGLAG
jgi:hypothetical protein